MFQLFVVAQHLKQLGCFVDTNRRDLSGSYYYSSSLMTNGKCIEFCATKVGIIVLYNYYYYILTTSAEINTLMYDSQIFL